MLTSLLKVASLSFFSVLLMTFSSQAQEPEVYNYKLKGMDCDGCAKMIKKAVCGINGIEKCDISVGKMTLQAAPGTQLDQTAIAEAVKKAGGYSVESFEKSKTADAAFNTKKAEEKK